MTYDGEWSEPIAIDANYRAVRGRSGGACCGKNFLELLFFPAIEAVEDDVPTHIFIKKRAWCIDIPWFSRRERYGTEVDSFAVNRSMFLVTECRMDTPTLNLLSRAMKAYGWRMQALASNVANLDTPGYQRLSVSFEDALQEVRRSNASPRDVDAVTPRMRVEGGAPILEDELMELADTQMRTQLASRALRHHFDMLRTGITGRSG